MFFSDAVNEGCFFWLLLGEATDLLLSDVDVDVDVDKDAPEEDVFF